MSALFTSMVFAGAKLTGDTCEKLSGKVLDLAVWEGHESIALQEVEDAGSE